MVVTDSVSLDRAGHGCLLGQRSRGPESSRGPRWKYDNDINFYDLFGHLGSRPLCGRNIVSADAMFFIGFARDQQEAILGLVPSNVELRVLTPVFFHPSHRRDVADIPSTRSPRLPFFSSPTDSRTSTATSIWVHRPTMEQAEAGPSTVFPCIPREYGPTYSEVRLAERIPDISYTRSCAPPKPVHHDYLGLSSYSVLPPDDISRMSWTLGRFFKAITTRENMTEESRESRPSPPYSS
ncbi:hypothetical protein PIB30_084208 [Stylosanthes scabra]|uniref:Uncharacterized protein n=1 Tax=Stylosanthes scabra TaxID=79078 RepID=A0ABU6WSF7_9FABA|nr:hypothetical protein [Stylosanthes scabra]